MGKFKPKKFGATVLIVIFAVFLVYLGSTRDQGLGISVPAPLSTITLTDGKVVTLNVPNPSIACWINVNAKVFDANGRVIGTEASSFLQVNPITAFSLTDIKTQKELLEKGGFEIVPSIKCVTSKSVSFEPTNPNLFDTNIVTGSYPSVEIPLKLDPATLIARVYSVASDGKHLIDTYNAGFDTTSLSITDAKSHNIGIHKIGADRILVYLEDGKYDSYQHIVLEGVLVLHWAVPNAEGQRYVIPLSPTLTRNADGQIVKVSNPLIIYRQLAVEKNVSENPPRKDCTDGQIWDEFTQACVNAQPTNCPKGEVLSGNICVKINTGGIKDVSVNEYFEKLQTCVQSGQPDCLADPSFIPLWLFGIGFVVIIGAVAQRKAPDIYGIPPSGFG